MAAKTMMVATIRISFALALILPVSTVFSQTDTTAAIADIKKFQRELNEEYLDAVKSPLPVEDRKQFKSHEFYPIGLQFRVQARLKVTNNTPFFNMPTTSMQPAEERIYGYIEFSLEGKNFKLPVYQSSKLMKTQEYKDYLFFPFTDLTNGEGSYHGGRYIDLRIPDGEEILVDFNKAYNPYCACSSKYSCPIVPRENQMNVKVTAGVRYKEKK